jgi:glycolate oxidase iron-sulfur subunit
VQYHRLLDIGREVVAEHSSRPWPERLLRRAIRAVCLRPHRLAILLALGRPFRFALPSVLKGKIPARAKVGGRPSGLRDRRMSLLRGCVQSVMAPQINAANRRVFDNAGITLAETPGVVCCGALSFHLDAPQEARAQARGNIDCWLAELDGGAEAVVVNASGCAAFIRDYPDVLADDPVYAVRARRLVERLRDPVEVLLRTPPKPSRAPVRQRIAVHQSCTLRNGPGLGDAPERLLASLGYEPQPVANAHLCCGSAGAYSILQPTMAKRLRAEKIASLTAGEPEAILTANIGCWMHLGETSPVPVRHWLEAVDDLL